MKTFLQLLTVLCFMSTALLQAQTTTTDFESFGLSAGEFNNNAMSDGFEVNNLFMPNSYNEEFSAWSGWAISATTDVTTPGFMNDLSSSVGTGANGSTTYATTYAFSSSFINLNEAATVDGFYITNSTYARLSMLEGDFVAKRFGGETGDDPDFFLLTIKGYLNGEESQENIDFYLADYRFDDNSMDYIVNEWTYLDLSTLGQVDSLSFSLSSSDNGEFGMNTPAYFCIDEITTTMPVSTNDIALESLAVFPNPTSEYINFNWTYASKATAHLINQKGQLVAQQNITGFDNRIDVSHLAKGVYTLVCKGDEQTTVNRIVIQ